MKQKKPIKTKKHAQGGFDISLVYDNISIIIGGSLE